MLRQRVAFVDYARGIGITLMVLGHVLRGLFSADLLNPHGAWAFLDTWIYTFHMPLFLFVSGLFLERSLSRRPAGVFISARLKTIVYPYLVWSVVQTLLQILLSGRTNHVAHWADLWGIGINPVMQFWFLYVLFLGMMLYATLRWLRLPWQWAAVGIVLWHLLPSPVALGGWPVLAMLRSYVVYLVLGIVVGNLNFVEQIANWSLKTSTFIGVLGWGVVGLIVWQGTTGQYPVQLMAAIGITGTLGWSRLLEDLGHLHHVQVLGRRSLEIFVAHTLALAAIRIGLIQGLGIEDITTHLTLGVMGGVYAPLGLAWGCQRFGLRYVFTWPASVALPERLPQVAGGSVGEPYLPSHAASAKKAFPDIPKGLSSRTVFRLPPLRFFRKRRWGVRPSSGARKTPRQ